MEKALPAKRRRAAKGTVLFTVVAVMMVLIVFLMGTLALAATANNRAQAVYQKAQTEATARAVLEAAYQAIADDTTATGIRSNVTAATTTTPGTVDVHLSDTNQTYRVEIYDSGDTKSYYDPVERKWDTSKVYRLSVTVDKTKADTTYNAFITAKTENIPGGGGGGGGGGAFVSMGSASTVATGGLVSGGSYLGVDESLFTYKVDVNGIPEVDASGKKILDPNGTYIKPTFNATNNPVYMDSPYYVNGNYENLAGGNGLTMHFKKPGDFMYVNGDFKSDQAGTFRTDYTGFIATATMTYDKTPYIYIEGTFDIGGSQKIFIGQPGPVQVGTTVPATPGGFMTNMYVGSINTHGNGLVLYGDLYTMNDAENYVGDGQTYDSSLYKWTDANISVTGGPNTGAGSGVYGSWFSKGNITYKPKTNDVIQGDLRCEKNITIGGQKVEIKGDLLCGDTLTIDGANVTVAGAVYAGKINVKSGSLTCANYTTYEATGTVNGAANILSGGGTPIGTKEVTRTVTLKNDGGFVDGFFFETPFNGNANQVKITFECTESTTTVTKITGQPDQTATEGPNTVREEAYIWSLPWDWSGTAMDYALISGEYNYLKTKYQAQINAAAAGSPTPTIETLYQFDIASQIPASKAPIYPAAYEPSVIKTTLNQSKPAPADYSTYYTNSADPSFGSKGTDIDALGKLTAEGGHYKIEESSYLHGITVDKNIYIKPKSNIRVMFDTVAMGGNSIIVDDSTGYTVELYVSKTASTAGTLTFDNGAIVTENYWKKLLTDTGSYLDVKFDTVKASKNATIDVRQLHKKTTDWDYPNVVIKSDPGASLSMSNAGFITGMVRAPQMTFSFGQAKLQATINYYENNTIDAADNANYDGTKIKVGSGASAANDYTSAKSGRLGVTDEAVKNIGLIGQLIAGDIIIPQTEKFGMVYVDIPSGTVIQNPPTPPSTNPFAGKSSVLFYDYY